MKDLGTKTLEIERLIIEVGSTNTKVDIYDGKKVERLDEITILFKKNYKELHHIKEEDINILIEKILKLKEKYNNIYICGTSIFRELEATEKEKFQSEFKKRTGLEFNIISQAEENEYTVLGATRFTKEKACVFVGGGGSTEISIFDDKIIESSGTKLGVMDIMNIFPGLDHDTSTCSLEEVMNYIEERLNVPKNKADILILAGGGHEMFARNSGIKYEDNTLYEDDCAPIMMDIETRIKETKRYYESISLDEIKSRVDNPAWWYATRAMCAFVLVVAKKIEAKYVVPTNISMVYGLLDK